MKNLFDSHTHLLDEKYKDIIEEAVSGVDRLVLVSSPDEDIELYKELLKRDNISGMTGIHPHEAKDYDRLKNKMELFMAVPGTAAVGEIGLDYHYDFSPRDIQREVFTMQLAYAQEKNIPAVVHTREAFKDTFSILDDFKGVDILIHCFSGGLQELELAMDRGYYVSYGGAVTFSKSEETAQAVKLTCENLLLVETDCPYLSPVPFRGRLNMPAYLVYTVSKIAELRSAVPEYIASVTYANACRFFRIENTPAET